MDYQTVVPIGTKVKCLAPVDSDDIGWLALPRHYNGEIPDGYRMNNEWGYVTGYSVDDSRSYNGTQPIIVENHIYLGFDPKYWG